MYKQTTLDLIDNIMISALEGGINYWCASASIAPDKNGNVVKRIPYLSTAEMVSRGATLAIQPDDETKSYYLDSKSVLKGWKQYKVNNPKADPEDLDADAADAIIQIAIFGEVIYG